MGKGDFVYIWSSGGLNYFGVEAMTSITSDGTTFTSTNLPVRQCYNIDSKIDDGMPDTGRVLAYYNSNGSMRDYSANWGSLPTTCADMNNGTLSLPAYSLSSPANYGSGGNCALSFQFQ